LLIFKAGQATPVDFSTLVMSGYELVGGQNQNQQASSPGFVMPGAPAGKKRLLPAAF
jgi:hypothetical protein